MNCSASSRLARVAALVAGAALLLTACAMQRAQDAETAQKNMVGMSKEQVFACMGIPKRKGKQDNTEIWLYKSGNDRTEKSKGSGTLSGSKAISGSTLVDALTASIYDESEVKEKRYCLVQVVFKDNSVQIVRYSGPTGGFLTEDEQCAYATRNCLPAVNR